MDLYEISNEYRKKLDTEKCKKEGIYYTPEEIVKVMVTNLLERKNFTQDCKIIDMACGCGLFYVQIIEQVISLEEKKAELSTKDKQNKIKKYIEQNFFAIEKDKNSVDILKKYIYENYEIEEKSMKNIYNRDALFTNDFLEDGSFDFIIGNPPYVGHKSIESEYAAKLREGYSDIYVNKSDIYYCFFKKAVELLKENGICSYIVPRYFLESHSALNIRKFLENNTEILSIVDFRNSDVFDKNIGVSPCIITFKKNRNQSKNHNPKIRIIDSKYDLELLKKGINKRSDGVLYIDDTSWSVLTFEEKKIMDSIWKKEKYKLGDIVKNYQGIITGCDKAFIVDKNSELLHHIDNSICKKWIKSKDIGRYNVKVSDNEKIIIYTDNMEYDEMSSILKEHLESFRLKLEKRREVVRGVRQWYELQWGRQYDVFEQPKIIYPFKSKDNRFALDYGNSFFSADVYFFTIKDEFIKTISYEYLLCLLNSRVYEKYMQSFLKKLGNSVYEYYPYRLLEAYIFVDENYKMIENIGKRIIKEGNKRKKDILIKKVDEILENSLELTKFIKK